MTPRGQLDHSSHMCNRCLMCDICVCAIIGALELESVEVKVQLGEDKTIEDLLPKQVNDCVIIFYRFILNNMCFQPLEMHEVVAECMIFANHWLAKKLYQSLPSRALVSGLYCIGAMYM